MRCNAHHFMALVQRCTPLGRPVAPVWCKRGGMPSLDDTFAPLQGDIARDMPKVGEAGDLRDRP